MSMRHWCAKIFLLVGIILAGCDANVKVGNFDNDRASALDRVEEPCRAGATRAVVD
jgi:hypothetical protein